MSDIEMTKLCAEAMGWKHLGAVGSGEAKRDGGDRPYCLSGANDWWNDPEGRLVCGPCQGIPNPLADDAHAMALIRRHPIRLTPHLKSDYSIEWCCESVWPFWTNDHTFSVADTPSRAIVECVANMQRAKP